MRAAFHAAAVHQQVRALDALAGWGMGQSPQPAVRRALRLCGLCGFAQRRVKGCADVVDEHARIQRQPTRGGHQGERVFFFAQMAHHHHAQVARGFG
jgi:hypothetical protein